MADPLVLILLGDRSAQPVAADAAEVFTQLGVTYEVRVASAHHTPEFLSQLIKDSSAKILVAMADVAAGIPATVAAMTMRPVIGVPVSGETPGGSLWRDMQFPSGLPVVTVGLDRGDNAALFAASILALNDEKIQGSLAAYREKQREIVIQQDKKLQDERAA